MITSKGKVTTNENILSLQQMQKIDDEKIELLQRK